MKMTAAMAPRVLKMRSRTVLEYPPTPVLDNESTAVNSIISFKEPNPAPAAMRMGYTTFQFVVEVKYGRSK